MVVTPPSAPERAQTEPSSRTLAYQERIARAAEEAQEEQAAAPQVAVPAETPQSQDKQETATPEAGASPSAPGQDATEMAGLPPEEAVPTDPDALPWQQPRPSNPGMADPMALQPEAYGDPYDPRAPRPGPYGDPNDPRAPQHEAYDGPYDPSARRPDRYDPYARRPAPYGGPNGPVPRGPAPYGDPNGPMPPQRDAYGDPYDPNAWPPRPGARPEEWVQVLVSGVGMHGTASEDSPMLFAFPSGRVLRVVSRYGDWVEVTDPKSATTGWMRARYLAPVAGPGARQAAGPMYEKERRRGRRWWRRFWRNF